MYQREYLIIFLLSPISLLLVTVLFRSSEDLVGHPLLRHLPTRTQGAVLYKQIAKCLPPSLAKLAFTLRLTGDKVCLLCRVCKLLSEGKFLISSFVNNPRCLVLIVVFWEICVYLCIDRQAPQRNAWYRCIAALQVLSSHQFWYPPFRAMHNVHVN